MIRKMMVRMMVNDYAEDDGVDGDDRDNMTNDDPDGGW